MSWQDNVIVALDYENPEDALRLIETLGAEVCHYKIGPVLFTRSGPEIIRVLHNKKKSIFVDLKLHDTPNVVGETVRQLAEMGVHFATVHCMGGNAMLEAANKGCRGSKLKLLGVTLLTSFKPEEALNWGWQTTAITSVHKLTQVAETARLAGIICSAQEAKDLRPKVSSGFLLVTPGIRIPNKEVFEDDQIRVTSPRTAFESGADYIIIGRPVTQSPTPLNTVKSLFDHA